MILCTSFYRSTQYLLFGQFLSLLAVTTSVTTKYLDNFGVKTPGLQVFLSYLIITIVCSALYIITQCNHRTFLSKFTSSTNLSKREWQTYRESEDQIPSHYSSDNGRALSRIQLNTSVDIVANSSSNHVQWWKYLLAAVLDVEGNYAAVLAFRYGQFATVSLLFHLTIPYVTLFSYFFLRTKYCWRHYLGCFVALGGCILTFLHDVLSENDFTCKNEKSKCLMTHLKGDLLALCASIFYAATNVLHESIVTDGGLKANYTFLCNMGGYAVLIAGIQCLLTETKMIAEIEWKPHIISCFVGFAMAILAFYLLSSIFLRISESLMFNLSLLTTDIYTALASYFLFDEQISYVYWIAMSLNILGVLVYSIDEPGYRYSSEEGDQLEDQVGLNKQSLPLNNRRQTIQEE